jgi:hypothetical protein
VRWNLKQSCEGWFSSKIRKIAPDGRRGRCRDLSGQVHDDEREAVQIGLHRQEVLELALQAFPKPLSPASFQA